jgi:hypothetical protein
MKKTYNFLYFCFYSTVIRSDNDISHKRASDLLSILISFLLLAIYLRCLVVFELDLVKPKWLALLYLLSLFLGNMYLHGRYFNRNHYYKEIEEKFKKSYKGPGYVLTLISIGLILCAFIIFAISGITFSLYLHPR